jgi:hypothetical protein
MELNNKYMRVSMPDGTEWDVPVMVIARNRAERYKDEFDNSLERSLAEDTVPLFEADSFEVQDWAANNMDWSDVKEFAIQHFVINEVDSYQEGWMNGDKEFVTRGE